MQPSNLRFIDPSTIIVHNMKKRNASCPVNVLKMTFISFQRNLTEKPDFRLKEKSQKESKQPENNFTIWNLTRQILNQIKPDDIRMKESMFSK